MLFNDGTAFIFWRCVLATKVYGAIVLIGGGNGALDLIDGTALVESDAAIVISDGSTYFYRLDATSAAAESSPDIIEPDANGGDKRWILQTIISDSQYIRLHHTEASGTSGGDLTASVWNTRPLTEDIDTHDLCSVAANVITLQAGTYTVRAMATTYDVNTNQLRLRNTSDGTTALLGSNMYCYATRNMSGHSNMVGRFTIASAKNFEFQHRTGSTKTVSGMGLALTTGELECYMVAEFWRE